VSLLQPDQCLKESGLASPWPAHDGDTFGGSDGEVGVVEGVGERAGVFGGELDELDAAGGEDMGGEFEVG